MTAATRFVPANLRERQEFAKSIAAADLLPRAYRGRPGNVLLMMEYADSLQIPYAQALATMAIINGKPTATAALVSALVRRAGHRLRVTGDDHSAHAEIIRFDDPDFTYTSDWDIDRAVRAHLVELRDGKPYARDDDGNPLPWETHTAAMLKARAITECAREACQDALMGIQYTAEELGAVINEDGTPVEDPARGRAAERPARRSGGPEISPTDDEWSQEWREAFNAAAAAGDRHRISQLAREAGEHQRPDLVAHAQTGWQRVATKEAPHEAAH